MLTMDALIRLMFEKKASDLHLSPDSPPALRIDGEIVPTELEVLQPTAISKMVQSKYDLSLFTCTYDGTTRFTVRCRLLQIK